MAGLTMTTTSRGISSKWPRNLLRVTAIFLASAVGGAILVWLTLRFAEAGAVVLVGLAAVPLVAFVIAADPRIGLLLVFVTFPFSTLITSIGPIPLQPVEVTVVVVMIATFMIRVGQRTLPMRWHPAVAWIVALLAWTTVALPSAPDRTLAIKQLLSVAAAALFVCVVLSICRRAQDVTWTLGALVSIAAIAAGFALVTGEAPNAVYGGAVVADRLAGPFNQPNQLGSFAAMMVLVAIGLALGGRSMRGRLLSSGASLLLLGALALSLSRGAWIGFLAGSLVLVGMLRAGRRALLWAALPIALAAGAIALIAPDSPQVQIVGARLGVLTTQSPYDTRDGVWAEAVRQIVEDPLTGQGPGNFPVASLHSGSAAGSVYADHAHNLFLNWAAEVGLPGAILIAGLMLTLAVTARRARQAARDERETAIVAGLAAALASVFVHGLVDYPLRNQVLWFTLWSLVALLLAVRRTQQR